MTTAGSRGAGPGVGDRIGNLTIERELGRGAYGAVFLARDALIDRPVALKVLLPRDRPFTPAERDSFLAEARVIAGLPSTHIVTLYSVHETDEGGWLIEMEFVDGGSLQDLILDGAALPAGRAAPIVRGVLQGLRAAHERGVLHRDVKPANVLIGRDGQVKLADFGLALVAGQSPTETPEGSIVGTPWYMAPELFAGQPATIQSDLWAVGTLIHEMFAGLPPFTSTRLPRLLSAIRSDAPPPLPAGTAPVFVRIVARCLAKRPADRPRSAAELLEELDRQSMRTSGPVTVTIGSGRLLGRQDELRRALDVLHAVSGGKHAAVLAIHGEMGVGKSLLVEEARLTGAALGYAWLSVQATTSGLLRPLLSAARHHLTAGSDDEVALHTALRSRGFGPASPTLERLLAPAAEPTVETREQTVWALEHLIRGIAGRGPVCLAVEDLHLGSDEDVALLRDLTRRFARAPFLLIDSRLPPAEGVPRIGHPEGVQVVERIELGGLTPESIALLLDDHADGLHVQARVAERIARRSGGNPLLALELLRHLRQTGAVVAAEDTWVATPAWEEASLPAGLRDVFTQRLDRLGDEERELLEAGAVDGERFEGRTVAAVLELPRLKVLRRLQGLVRKGGLLRAEDDGFAFEHPVLRDVLYEGTAKELREALHAELAQHLEAWAEPVDPERLGTHWEHAGDGRRAREYLITAASRAAERLERRRALELIGRTGVIEGKSDLDLFARRGADLIHLGIVHRDMDRIDDARRIFRTIREAAERAGDTELAASADVQLVLTNIKDSTPQPDDAARLLAALERLPPTSRARGLANSGLGSLARRDGEFAAAGGWYQAADEVYVSIGAEHLHAATLSHLAAIAMYRGEYEPSIALLRDAAAISDRIGRRHNAAVDRVNAANVEIELGRLEGARDAMETALRTFELEGAHGSVAHCRAFLSHVYYSLGDLDEAARAADLGISGARDAGSERVLALCLLHGAQCDFALGRIERAARRVDESAGMLDRIEWGTLRHHVHVRRASLHACSGKLGEAEREALMALELVTSGEESPDDLASGLLAAGLLGLGGQVWSRIETALAQSDELAEAARERHVAAVRAAAALVREDGAPETLRAAARALDSPLIGNARAEMRVIAAWLRAVAHHRDGATALAVREGERAAAAAALLGHIWLEAVALRGLDEWMPSSVRRDRRRTLVNRVTAEIDSPELREHILRVWSPAGD